MKRKILAALLTLVMVFSLLPVSAWAEETTYSDVAGHWAQTAILRWSDYGVLQGSEGKFSPNGTLTRGQMAVILSRLLNLPAAPKPFCAAWETISPPRISNFTTTLCITMIPMASTENCRPSGSP